MLTRRQDGGRRPTGSLATWSALVSTLSVAILVGGGIASSAQVPLIAPMPAPSGLTLEVVPAGTMPRTAGANIASPQSYGRHELFLISHAPTEVYSLDVRDGVTTQIYEPSQTPAGITSAGSFALMNVVGDADDRKVYMVVTSTTLPTPGLTTLELPDPDGDPSGGREDFLYIDTFDPENGFWNANAGSGPLTNQDIYGFNEPAFTLFGSSSPLQPVFQVFFEWDYVDGVLANPRPFLALQTQGGFSFHTGGGMAIASDGRLVYATGDNLPFGMDGRRAPQDDGSHVSKLLLIDPATSLVEVAAKGLRNVQRIQRIVEPSGFAFTDIGGVAAEEVNFVAMSDVLDTTAIENFGWGRNVDGYAREGTYYVGPGVPFKQSDQPTAVGAAPVPEPGFRQPLAQYGRAELSPFSFVAAAGPVVSPESFRSISLALGDLPSGELYATTDAITGTDVPVHRVNLVDVDGDPVGPTNSLNDLAGGRSDPRFFVFPDGGAGVLLEATGAFYRLTEPVLAPSGAPGLSVSCVPSLPTAGGLMTCTVSGGDPGIDILWRASYNPVLGEAGVTLDPSGSGTFSFTIPAEAVGEDLMVELVDWMAPVSLGVIGAVVPTSVPSGGGPSDRGLVSWSALGAAALAGLVLLRRRYSLFSPRSHGNHQT